MNTILISYDLNGYESSQSYTNLINAIKKYSSWAKPLESFWLVKTNQTTEEVREALKPYLDANDEIMTVNVTGCAWSTHGVPKNITDWFYANM